MSGKSIISQILSILLCVCYVVSITGIDIHVDGHNGETYVVSVLGGVSCEDIHEDDHCCCGDHHDCNHSEGICDESDDCSDSISVINVSGFEKCNSLPSPAILLLCSIVPEHTPDCPGFSPDTNISSSGLPDRDRLTCYSQFRI